jgi:hypothetical protein
MDIINEPRVDSPPQMSKIMNKLEFPNAATIRREVLLSVMKLCDQTSVCITLPSTLN